jgi:hypothetical protein
MKIHFEKSDSTMFNEFYIIPTFVIIWSKHGTHSYYFDIVWLRLRISIELKRE